MIGLLLKIFPERVSADVAYQALERVMTDVLNDDTELFKQFSNNDSFKSRLENMMFDVTYKQQSQVSEHNETKHM